MDTCQCGVYKSILAKNLARPDHMEEAREMQRSAKHRIDNGYSRLEVMDTLLARGARHFRDLMEELRRV